MSRTHRLDYAGAGSPITPTRGRRLGRNWAVQRKWDGAYAHLHLDGSGRVANVISRTGRPYTTDAARSLIGVLAGYPFSELVAEIDDHTQQGLARYRHQGYAMAHVHDAVRIGRDYLAAQPYSQRRHRLHDMIGDLECSVGSDTPWTTDANERAHCLKTGQFVRPVPQSWRRLSVVEQLPATQAQNLWDDWVEHGGEGLVFVAQGAPMGKRGAKRKAKPVIDLDCTVISVEPRKCVLHWHGTKHLVVCSRLKFPTLAQGQIVSILCDGFYDDGAPRHARIDRVREDLR